MRGGPAFLLTQGVGPLRVYGGESVTQRRAVYPSAATSLSLARCSVEAQLLFTRLIAAADDQGRLQGDPMLVKASCMPLVDRASIKSVDRWLGELADGEMIVRYEAGGQPLIQIAKWHKYQGWLRHLRPSRWPAPEGFTDQTKGRGEADERPPGGGQPSADRPPSGGPDSDVSGDVDVALDKASASDVERVAAPPPGEPIDISLHKITTTHTDLFGNPPNDKAVNMYRDLLKRFGKGSHEPIIRAMYYCWNDDRSEYGYVGRVKKRLLVAA